MNAKKNGYHGNTRLLTEIDKDLILSKKRAFEKISSDVGDRAKKQPAKEGIISKPCAVDTLGKGFLNSCDKTTISARNDDEKILDSQERKTEPFSSLRMLHWVQDAAKHSHVEIGEVPQCSNWKNHATQEVWIQALLIREARFIRRSRNLDPEEVDQLPKKRRTSSLMSTNANVNFSRRLCKRCFATRLKDINCQKTETGNIQKEINMENNIFTKEPDSEVMIGPEFQAELPELSKNISEGDSKWLGTRLWPPEREQGDPILELIPIGNGRQTSCHCQFPNSVECTRFHVAEKRLRLKIELGSAFYGWMFNRMGEEVSLSWTAKEEDRFKDMMRLHAATSNKFWKNASKIFPSKKRDDVVSYYFNVFLIQRRNYQNRVTPHDIDSDDDEKQVGSVGERFGYAALKPQNSSLMTCIENKQFIEFE